MGYVIAVAGKGGTGKTTLSALIVRLLKEKKSGSILAIDGDPNSNLAEALGMAADATIGSIIDDIAAHPEQIKAGMPKDRFIEYKVQTAIEEGDGFDMLTMGRPEGPGCYCYANNVLRNIMGKLIKDYDFIVIDNEAGLEHFSRRTTRAANTLVVVSDATAIGLRSARRIRELVKEMGIKTGNNFLVINRADSDIEKEKADDTGLKLLCRIPSDTQIQDISFNGGSLWKLAEDAVSLKALRKSGDKLWQ